MKNPWQIRFRESLNSLVRYARVQNKVIDGQNIKDLENSIFGSVTLEPSTDNLIIYPFELLDTDRFIAYNYAIESDINTITKSLDSLESAFRNVSMSVTLEEIALRSTEKLGILSLILLQASTFIDGITRTISIPEELNQITSNLQSISGILMPRTESATLKNRTNLIEDDIEILVTKQQTSTGNQLSGRKSSILDNSFERGFTLTVFSLNVDTIEVTTRIKTRTPISNRIILELTPGSIGMKLTVSGLSASNKSLNVLFSNIVSHEIINIDTIPIPLEQLIITMEKDFPDTKTESRQLYYFTIEKIKIENTLTSRTGNAITLPIELPNGTDFVAILSEDFIPKSSTIRYEISAASDAITDSNNWFDIIPNNREPIPSIINGELPEDRFISLDAGSVDMDIGVPSRWNLKILPNYKRRIYNLLEGITKVINQDISITNGKIITNAGVTILEESIRLRRGIGDWEISQSIVNEEDKVSNIIHEGIYGNTIQNWFDNIEIMEPISQSFSLSSGFSNTLQLKYNVDSFDHFRIEDDSGKIIPAVINSGIGTNTIVINFSINAGIIYTVNYLTKIRPNTTIIESSLIISLENNILERGIDYIYSPGFHTVILLRGASKFSTESIFEISYDRLITSEGNGAPIYRTWLQVDKTELITIQPFTPAEFSAGNYHTINGIDISLNTSFEVNPGIHEIISTQPEPSAQQPNDVDINQITNKKSKAGINLANLQYTAFRDSMTKITFPNLEFNADANDLNIYSYTNNQILMLRKPTFIDQAVLDNPTTNNRTGQTIRGKKYNSQTAKYLTVPERFNITFAYRTLNTNRYVRIRITMNRGSDLSPRITKLGIVPVNSKVVIR